MKTISLIQGTPEWAAHRSHHFNASDAPAMMSCSPYMTRTELLTRIKTGISPDVDPATRRRFDDGHRFEALARPLAERIIGEELYAVTGTNGKLSASFDGLTLLEDTAWEHKSMNASLYGSGAPWGDGFELPLHYRVQMEQQMIVSGAGRVLFMASRWNDDDTLDVEQHCWYASDPDLRTQIIVGWQQFAADLAAYQPEAPAAAAPIGKAPESLPALHIVLKGEVSASNLATFKEVALAAIRSVNRDLQTDQDFADSAKARKWCEDIESKVAAAKEHALSQTASIDELFRTMDEISAEARRVRLELDKLEKARTVALNGEIVADGVRQFADHMRALNAAMPSPYMPSVPVDFGGAIKGLRSVASKKDAVATELARAKIVANEIAARIQANIKHLQEHASAHRFLFVDTATIVLKAPDDLQALVALRISQHERAEAAKAEAQRERIRAEEAAKLQRAADERARAEAEEKRRAEEVESRRATQAELAHAKENTEGQELSPTAQALYEEEAADSFAQRHPTLAQPAPATAIRTDSGARLSLGQINDRIAPLSISVAGLAELGFDPVAQVKASRLYCESDFPSICAAIARHAHAAAQVIPAQLLRKKQ